MLRIRQAALCQVLRLTTLKLAVVRLQLLDTEMQNGICIHMCIHICMICVIWKGKAKGKGAEKDKKQKVKVQSNK